MKQDGNQFEQSNKAEFSRSNKIRLFLGAAALLGAIIVSTANIFPPSSLAAELIDVAGLLGVIQIFLAAKPTKDP